MQELKVKRLRCEYKENPVGIDVLQPRFSWQIECSRRYTMQTAYQLQVAEDEGFSEIAWDTGKVDSDQSIHIVYAGSPLKSRARYFYRVKIWDNWNSESPWSDIAYWEMGLLSHDEWVAEWITPEVQKADETDEGCPMLRRKFVVKKAVKAARIYATSLGLYELELNGRRVGDWLLTPGWTSYRKRLQYQTYDVTDMLHVGENAVGAILGNGWYKGSLAWEGNRNIYGDKKALLFQMHIKYEDGSEDLIVSDKHWKMSMGPILMSEIYNGETYDSRLEKNGWSTADYDDQGWDNVQILDHTKTILVAQENVPVRKIQEIAPKEILHTPLGEIVIDMGQNMVGWVRFTVEGEEGTVVTLSHAEVLDKEGNFYTDNLRTAKQTIRYILKGKGKEIFEPHFTFQGFRYVKVEGYPGELTLDKFMGVVIHSDMEPTGSFACSNELLNQLQHNIVWGQKGNFVDVPTDCPQRDERLGWTGDAQVFIRTACFNMNVAPFFTKWLRDMQADQLPDGGIPHVIPHVLGKDAHSSAAWADASLICPWTIYLCYGDKRILEQQYECMKAWVEHVRKQGDNEYLWNTGFHFGDWLGLDAKENSYTGATAKDYIATAFYAYSTSLLVKTARILHKEDDIREYEELYEKIVESFRSEFVTPAGRIAVPTQTAHVLALMFDLVEEKDKKRTIETLVDYLKENNNHLTTGFVGTPYLCHVLSENGYTELAYTLVQHTDYPSWLYQVLKGATTVWEHWDGIKVDGSFWSPDMNSFNHYAYGSIGDWLYRVAAGIDTDVENPGYKHVRIHPQPGGGLSWAKAELQTMYGLTGSAWEKNGDKMELTVTVAPNTIATVYLPDAKAECVYEDGKKLRCGEEGVLQMRETDGGLELELGSGVYHLVY